MNLGKLRKYTAFMMNASENMGLQMFGSALQNFLITCPMEFTELIVYLPSFWG